MSSASEVAKALELLGSNNSSSVEFAKFSSITTSIVDNLIKNSSFSSSQKPPARDALRSTHSKDGAKLTFLLVLSDTLKLDESKVESTWEQLRKDVSPGTTGFELSSLETLLTAREVYTTQRSQLWSLLHEIIRIDLDSQHPWHATVSSVLDSFLKRDLVGEVIKYLLQALPQWSPANIDRSVLTAFSDHEVSRFIQSVHQAWAVSFVEEFKHSLDTLILLSYSRQNLNLSELKELLCKFFTQPLNETSSTALQILLVHSMRSDLLKVEAELQAVNFRYIVLFSGCFQFWRLFQADLAAQRDHPLLLPSTPDYNNTNAEKKNSADAIFASLQGVTELLHKSAVQQAKHMAIGTNDTLQRSTSDTGALAPFNTVPDSPAMRIVLYLWQCFLRSFSECTIVGAEYVSTQGFEKFHQLASKFDIMDDLAVLVEVSLSGGSKLAQRVSLDPTTDGNAPPLSSEPNMFIYCSILQELTNVLILAHTLRDESSVLDIGPVTNLVENTYRGQSALCGGFWASWTDATASCERITDDDVSDSSPVEHYYPLCRLVQTLLATTPHDPVFLFKILTALACSPQACMTLLDLLNQPVNLIGFEAFKRLQFRAPVDREMMGGSYEALQWDGITAWLREHKDLAPGTICRKINLDATGESSRGQGLWSGKDNEGSTKDSSRYYGQSGASRTSAVALQHMPSTDHATESESNKLLSSLCNPAERSQGVVVDVDVAQRRCLVRWDTQSLWWTLAIDLVIMAASPAAVSASADFHVSLQALLDLLNALFKQGSVVAFFLETKWNEITLLSLLQDLKLPELFPLLSRHEVRISSLRTDPAAAFDRLTQEFKIPRAVAEQIVTRLMSPSASESALYELSFALLVSRAVLCLLLVAIKTNSNSLLLTSWAVFVTISDVSAEWAQALAQQSALYFPSPRGAGGVYEQLLSTVSAGATAAVVPEVFYLSAQHLIKTCAERRSETGPSLMRVLFDAFDAKQVGSLTAHDIAHGLSVRGHAIATVSVEDFFFEAGLATHRALDYAGFNYFATGIDIHKSETLGKNGTDKGVVLAPSKSLQDFRAGLLRIAHTLKENTINSSEGHLRAASIFVLNQFNSLYRATHCAGANPEEGCFLLLKSVQAVDAALFAEKSLLNYVIESVANNVAFLEAMVHLSTLLGVLSTQTGSDGGSGRPTTFKDLFSTSTAGAAPVVVKAESKGVLPLDFTSLLGATVPALVRESLLRTSAVCASILTKLVRFGNGATRTSTTAAAATTSLVERRLAENLLALLSAQSPQRLSGLSWVAVLFASQLSSTVSAPSTVVTAKRGSNLSMLFGVLDLPVTAAPNNVVGQYQLAVSRLLMEIVQVMPSGPGLSNITDCIGPENIAAVASTLATNVRSENTKAAQANSQIQTNTLEFLLLVAQKQPTALCLFLSAQKASTAAGNGDLVEALLHLLSSADHLYALEPQTLHTLYQLLIRICKASEYHIMVKTTLVLIQSKKFWDYVTAPLMLDVPSVPSVQVQYRPYSSQLWAESVLRSHHGFADQAVAALQDEVAQCPESSSFDELETETVLHCHRLQCHAAALELLSIERYGKFYELDAAVALQLTKKMQAFYVKATETHRFISWIKHYLLISVDQAAFESVETLSNVLGVALTSTLKGTYGGEYLLPAELVRGHMESFYRGAAVRNLEIDECDRVDLYLLAKYKSELVKYNLSCSLSHAALALIHSWRQFLEFYVLPGSAAKQQQQSRDRANSGDATTPVRGRKHSFDGDDIDGFTSTSPQVGTLSPVTNTAANSSPTAAKGSAFSGDKRSYEVVSEVMTQLECHRTDGYMNTDIGRKAIAEKCELLVSMVHHQLRVVASRTSDPSKSVILTRDIGSMRLTQDKMEKLLEKLDDFYRDLVFAPVDSAPVGLLGGAASISNLPELKNTIALRILTAMMLLLNSIYTFNSADDVHSKLSLRRRSIYEYAVTALKNLTRTHGRAVFSNTNALSATNSVDAAQEETKATSAPASEASDSLSTEQAIAQVSLQILKLATPRGSSAEPLISLSDGAAWKALFHETGAITLLTQVVSELSAATGDMPQWDHDYIGWRVSELAVGSKGGSECNPPRLVDRRPVHTRVYAETRCMLASLLSAVEALISGVSANVITVQDSAQLNVLLQTLITAPVLRNYQQMILSQPEALAAVLMGYNAHTTELSLVATCWLRVINLIESLIVRIGDGTVSVTLRVSEAQQESVVASLTARQELQNTLCTFLRTYVDLLLLPMRPASHRYSVQQLTFTRAAFNLFSAANTKLPVWRVTLSALHPEVTARATSLLRVFSLLLWHGEDMETWEQQRRLLSHCVAISKAEKREERSMQIRKLRKRSGSLGGAGSISRLSSVSGTASTGSPQHVHFGATTVLGPGASIMKSGEAPASTSALKSRKPIGYYSSLRGEHSSSGPSSGDNVQHSMVEFLLDIEAHMIAAMAPLSAYLRQITPIPMEVSKYDEFGHPLFVPGQRVFYISDQTTNGALLEGFVQRLHPSGDQFDVVLLDDLVECDVYASQVRYTAAPIVQYQSISDLAKHSIEELSTTAMFYHGHAELTNALSTAHLLRSLQLATSAVTNSRMQSQQLYPQAGQDLSVLAGQLAWLVVSNIAHHALAPMGREISMIHQLNDLKRAIRPRDAAHNYSASSTGSTSPFMSYLDQRDRGHVTPLGGLSSSSRDGPSGAAPSTHLKWMHTPEWSAYVTFLDKWCEEIFYMLGRGATLVTAEEEEEEESPSARIRKKRVGLRARIEWVQSPEEV